MDGFETPHALVAFDSLVINIVGRWSLFRTLWTNLDIFTRFSFLRMIYIQGSTIALLMVMRTARSSSGPFLGSLALALISIRTFKRQSNYKEVKESLYNMKMVIFYTYFTLFKWYPFIMNSIKTIYNKTMIGVWLFCGELNSTSKSLKISHISLALLWKSISSSYVIIFKWVLRLLQNLRGDPPSIRIFKRDTHNRTCDSGNTALALVDIMQSVTNTTIDKSKLIENLS